VTSVRAIRNFDRRMVFANGEVDSAEPSGGVVQIDCDTCAVRGAACSGCVVTVILGMPDYRVEWDDSEFRALKALAGGGLLPPLRLVTALDALDRQAG